MKLGCLLRESIWFKCERRGLRYLSDNAALTRKGGSIRTSHVLQGLINAFSIHSNGDSFSHKEAVTLLDKHARAPAVLELRVGAQVMLIINMPSSGLCNGSM